MHDNHVLNFFVFQLSSNLPSRVYEQGIHTHNKHIILMTIAFNLLFVSTSMHLLQVRAVYRTPCTIFIDIGKMCLTRLLPLYIIIISYRSLKYYRYGIVG